MPRKPTLTCRIPGCPNLQPCPIDGHEPKPWAGSDRRAHLPPGWSSRIVPRILRRDPICRACHAAPSAEVDHINGRDNHSDTNLQGLCKPCHKAKTASEAAAARRRARA